MNRIEAHFFTHPVPEPTLEQTKDSFFMQWGMMPYKVWHNEPGGTESLSDGYIKAVTQSDAEYLFIMEHDWQFMGKNIHHDLSQILSFLDLSKIDHFRFNKRRNRVAVWDTRLSQVEHSGLKCCLTPNVSNNPHIVRRESALQWIDNGWVVKTTGSRGIEENLTDKQIISAIYGGLNHPATVKHLDGSKRWS